jgi:hypothetical protein
MLRAPDRKNRKTSKQKRAMQHAPRSRHPLHAPGRKKSKSALATHGKNSAMQNEECSKKTVAVRIQTWITRLKMKNAAKKNCGR